MSSEPTQGPTEPRETPSAFYYYMGAGSKLSVVNNRAEVSNEAAQAMLEAATVRIKELEEQVRKRDKVITCLMFRGILESLPPPSEHRSSTLNWDQFLSSSIERARVEAQHPLRPLLERHRVNLATGAGKDRIMNPFGATLYRQLSTEIHQYLLSRSGDERTQFDFDETNWLIDQTNFLKSITPTTLDADTVGNPEVNWAEERRRYGHEMM